MPVHYPECAGQKYRPSNGMEGEMFMEQFCFRCRHDQDEDNPCDILTRSLWLGLDDADYPEEWVYDKDGRPECTSFHDVQSEKPAAARCKQTIDMFGEA